MAKHAPKRRNRRAVEEAPATDESRFSAVAGRLESAVRALSEPARAKLRAAFADAINHDPEDPESIPFFEYDTFAESAPAELRPLIVEIGQRMVEEAKYRGGAWANRFQVQALTNCVPSLAPGAKK